jgi:hypothetical protein
LSFKCEELVLVETDFFGDTGAPLIDFGEGFCEVVVSGLTDPDSFVGGPVFGAAAGVAGYELDEGAGEDLGGGVVSVLAGFEDFVFVEDAGGTVDGLFRAVVPADVYPLVASSKVY